MRSRLAAVLALSMLLSARTGEPFRMALPGYRYEFPRDHFSHPEFRTEWWYFTGNLRDSAGRRFGYELTFFRHALEPEAKGSGVWDVRDVWLAHFALSDLDGGRFLHAERMNRSGAGLAGADLATARIWNGNWSLDWTLDAKEPGGVSGLRLRAIAADFRIALDLRLGKPPVIHGENGISRKAAGEGRASHYISYTRLASRGDIVLDGRTYSVEGLSWMDHEIFSNSLEANVAGWDWFSLQFDDGSELMLYRLRRKDGSIEPFSSGTYVDPRGRSRHLTLADYAVEPGRTWKRYPIAWKIRVPSLGLEAAVSTRLEQQELAGGVRGAPIYWEGAIDITGTKQGAPLRGTGYLEMTGYAAAVGGL